MNERTFEMTTEIRRVASSVELLLCVDLSLDGVDLEKVEEIRRRVALRRPRKGSFYLRDERRRSNLRGAEKSLLTRIAQRKVNEGIIEDVDGIFNGGLNIVVKVPAERSDKLGGDSAIKIRSGTISHSTALIAEIFPKA